MAVAADEYDHDEAQNIEKLVKSRATKDDLEAAEVYNAAVKGYRKIGGEVCSFDESTVVSIKEVILRGSSGNFIKTMVLYDGAWIRK